MKIKNISISNFRYYSGDYKKDLEGKDFVLLSGANGFGKTSFIDAIEWCITGNCQRLKEANEERKKKDKMQTWDKGLLKNTKPKSSKNAPNKEVRVKLELLDGPLKIIDRVQEKEQLDKNLSTLSVTDSAGQTYKEEEAEKKIVEMLGMDTDDFYAYFICNNSKTERFRRSGREEMSKIISDFLKDYSTEEKIISSLSEVETQLNEKIKDLQSKIDKDNEEIEKLNQDIDCASQPKLSRAYPQQKIYQEENIQINESADIQQLKNQIASLKQYGYSKMSFNYSKVWRHRHAVKTVDRLNNQDKFLDEKGYYLTNMIRAGIYSKETYEASLKRVNSYQLLSNRLLRGDLKQIKAVIQEVADLRFEKWSKEYCDQIIKQWDEEGEELRKEKDRLDRQKEGDELIRSLSELVSWKIDLDEYGKHSNKCPLCGSEETWKKIDSDTLANEAKTFLKKDQLQHAKDLKLYKERKKSLEEKIASDAKNLATLIDKRKTDENIGIDAYKMILQNLKPYVSSITNHVNQLLNEASSEKDTKGMLKSFDCAPLIKILRAEIIEEKESVSKSLLSADVLADCEAEFCDLAKILNESEELLDLDWACAENGGSKELTTKVIAFENQGSQVSENQIDFDTDLLMNKLQILNSYHSLKSHMDSNKKISMIKTCLDENTSELTKLAAYLASIKRKKKEIQTDINQLQKDEKEQVGPYLFSIYQKLIKHNSFDSFNVSAGKQTKNKLKMLLMGDDETPLFNLLSEGQMGVFLVSYFFGSAMSRKQPDKFQTYFIDDITSCMDDINMLSFVDLFKYQLLQPENKRAMSQVFFATCDSNLCRMLEYKLEGMGISVLPLEMSL